MNTCSVIARHIFRRLVAIKIMRTRNQVSPLQVYRANSFPLPRLPRFINHIGNPIGEARRALNIAMESIFGPGEEALIRSSHPAGKALKMNTILALNPDKEANPLLDHPVDRTHKGLPVFLSRPVLHPSLILLYRPGILVSLSIISNMDLLHSLAVLCHSFQPE